MIILKYNTHLFHMNHRLKEVSINIFSFVSPLEIQRKTSKQNTLHNGMRKESS